MAYQGCILCSYSGGARGMERHGHPAYYQHGKAHEDGKNNELKIVHKY